MFGLGAQELLLILLIVLVLFGAKRLPEMARGLGKSISEFKKGVREVDQEVRSSLEDERKPASGTGDTSRQNPPTPRE
jgi:sec-independent protein translocase protein TatA